MNTTFHTTYSQSIRLSLWLLCSVKVARACGKPFLETTESYFCLRLTSLHNLGISLFPSISVPHTESSKMKYLEWLMKNWISNQKDWLHFNQNSPSFLPMYYNPIPIGYQQDLIVVTIAAVLYSGDNFPNFQLYRWLNFSVGHFYEGIDCLIVQS